MISSVTKSKKLLVIAILVLLFCSVVATTGFTISAPTPHRDIGSVRPIAPSKYLAATANLGGGDDGDEQQEDKNEGSSEPVNVIKNGSFEARDSDPMNGVAIEWKAYSNGQADFGWYDETWPEAVKSGEHAQLMEIFLVDGNILDRTIAIYQTVNVVPNAAYDLTLHALMRTQAPEPLRNKDEYEMSWGIDYFGEANYDNVEEWVHMPLTEQFRLGSHGDIPDDKALFYEVITDTVQTRASNRITLFVRGVKKFPNGTEVNFDVDDVSLVGPRSGSSVIITPNSGGDNLPVSGSTLPPNLSIGALILGGLVVVLLGAGATANLLLKKEDR